MAFALWGSVGTFFTTGGSPIANQHWDRSQGGGFNGDLLWIDTATPSAGYVVGNPQTYTIYLTSQDRFGDKEDAVAIGTTTEVFPFLTNSGSSSTAAGVVQFSSSGGVNTAGAFYWAAGAVAGTYDLKFQGLTNTIANIPGASSAINLSGGAVTLESGISSPSGWSYQSNATNLLLAYSQKPTGATQNVYVQAFDTAGNATSALTAVATGVSSGMAWGVGTDGTNFFYAHEDNTAALAAIDIQTFNTTTGALGSTSVIQTSFNNIASFDGRYFNSGANFFGIVEGSVTGGNDTIDIGLFTTATGARIGSGASFTMSGTSAVHWQAITIAGNELVLAYADASAVHLKILDSVTGNLVGTDFVVPGLTGFDRIRSLGDGRIELDYRPSGTGDPVALIYDTRTAAINANGTSGFDQLVGTTFADTLNASGGSDWLNGGLGADTADYSSAVNGINAVVIGGNGTVAKAGIGTDRVASIERLIGTTAVDVFTVDSAEFVNGVSGFDYLIEASASVNLTYGVNFINIAEVVTNVGTNTIDASADPNNILIYGSIGTDTLSLGTGGGYLFSGGGTGNVLNGGANAVNSIIDSGGTSTMNGGTGSAVNYFYVSGTNDTVHGAGAFNAVIYQTTDATYTTIAADNVQEVIFNGGTNVGDGTGATSFLYLYGGSGNDTLTTGTAGGYLIGGAGTNTLHGGGGTNVFIADNAAGIDHMFGGSGSNVYYVDANSDVHGAGTFNTVIELQQNVSLTLGGSLLGSNVQQLILNGGTNTADFSTASSSVYLYGGSGNDTLKGGTGNDFLYGALGNNTFQFQVGWGQDTVNDFSASGGNKLDLTALSGLGVHSLADITQTIVNGNDVITSSHTGANQITLVGVGSVLTGGSFLFA